MSVIPSQITSITIVYPSLYSRADQRKHQSSASQAFVRGIHRWLVNSPHKRPVTWKMFPFDNVIMMVSYTKNGINLFPLPSVCNSTRSPITFTPLQWRHNGRDGTSNHQPYDCLLNRLFRRRSKKTSKLASLAFVRVIHRWPLNSPHKWPVTRKIFPSDDVIMTMSPNFRNPVLLYLLYHFMYFLCYMHTISICLFLIG